MNATKHCLIFLGCLGCVGALRIAWAGHFEFDRHEVVAEATKKRSLQIEEGWLRQTYTNFSAVDTVSALSRKAPLSSLPLSEVQRTKLQPRLLEVLLYFEHPDPDEYYRLKTDRLRWTFRPGARASNLLASSAAQGRPEGRPEDARLLVRTMWEQTHTGKPACLPRLSAICLDTVAGGILRTNGAKALLTRGILKQFTAVQEAVDPGFVYDSGQSPADPLLFELGFLAKASETNSAGTVYISLLWVDQDQEWALNRLMTDKWLHIKTIF